MPAKKQTRLKMGEVQIAPLYFGEVTIQLGGSEELLAKIRKSEKAPLTDAERLLAMEHLWCVLRRLANNVGDPTARKQFGSDRRDAAALLDACKSQDLAVDVQAELYACDENLATFESLARMSVRVQAYVVRALVPSAREYEATHFDGPILSAPEAARKLGYATGKKTDAGAKRVRREIKAGLIRAVPAGKKYRFDRRTFLS